MNIQDWFPLGLTGLISLQSKGLSSLLQHHGSIASFLWRSAFFMVQLSHLYMTTGKTICSGQFSHSVVSNSLWPYGLQHARLPCALPTFGACSSSCPSSQWCHPTISSSVIPFSSHLQSFPAAGSFPVSQLLSGGQSIGASASLSVLPMNIQDWFPLGLTGLISVLSKGISRVFPNITVQSISS